MEVNKQFKRKPLLIPKISDVFQKLQGFKHETALDLNMAYYTIRLNTNASRIFTIILPWGKHLYQRLPMGIAGLVDIFQEKMSGSMGELEFVRMYLDDLLILTRDSFEDQLSKLEVLLEILFKSGLDVNSENSTFGAENI